MPDPTFETQVMYKRTRNAIADGIGDLGIKVNAATPNTKTQYYNNDRNSNVESYKVTTPVTSKISVPRKSGVSAALSTVVPVAEPKYVVDTSRSITDSLTSAVTAVTSEGKLPTTVTTGGWGNSSISDLTSPASLGGPTATSLGPLRSVSSGGAEMGGTSVYIDTTAERSWSSGGSTQFDRNNTLVDWVWEHQKGKKAYLEVVNNKGTLSGGGAENEISVEFILLNYSLSQSEDVQMFKGFNMTLINSFGSGVPIMNLTMELPHNRLKPWFGNFNKLYGDKIKASAMIRKGYECYLYIGNDSFSILPLSMAMQRDSSGKYTGVINLQSAVVYYDIYSDTQTVITSIDAKKAGNMSGSLKNSASAASTVAGKNAGGSFFGGIFSGLSNFFGGSFGL